ncbi:MAG: hypothetical protein NZ889_02545 [Candidatus Pacearchaeota archaeon]|nr:hypothetical protein [Candidatus Pacearchaeota archaeon]
MFISNTEEEKKEKEKIEIEINEKDLREITREIISAYINNYKIIILSGNELREKILEIKKVVQGLVGIEMIEQNSNTSIIKDVLNPKEVPVEDILRRIDNMIRVIFFDLESFLKEKNLQKKDLKMIAQTEEEIDRLSLLLLKIIRKGLETNGISKTNLSPTNYLDLWWLTLTLEKIGDELKEIILLLSKLNFSAKKQFYFTFNFIKDSYINAMNSFYKKNKKLAHEIAKRKEEKILDRYLGCLKNKNNHKFSAIIGKIEAIQNAIYQISKVVLDFKNE